MLDRKVEKEILDILSRDCRTSTETIAKLIGVSEDETASLIDKLQNSGVIRRYGATIDWEQLGIEKVVAFIDVRVMPAREVGFDAIAMRIARFPEVTSVWLVSGGSDLRILVEAPNLRRLGDFIAEKIATIDGVTGTVTQFLLRKYKEDNVLYNEPDSDDRLIVSP